MTSAEPSAWAACGYEHLRCDANGQLCPTDAYWRVWLQRPELQPVDESCDAERALHASLLQSPGREVSEHEITALLDADAQANYRLFLGFRDQLNQAGSLEAAYVAQFQAGAVQVPPLFLDLVVQAIVCHVLRGVDDAWQWRAAEMLFRRQQVQVQEGRVLAGDSEVLDLMHETAGMGAVGRLLLQSGAELPTVQLEVLGPDNGARYWNSLPGAGRFNFLLDLTHEVQRELPHGLTLTMNRAQSGLKALAQVLEKWLLHFLGVVVHIRPEARVEDQAWRWHLGLDKEASALLNDLYTGVAVDLDRQKRLISLFSLRFENPMDVRADVRGKPVYLGLAMAANGQLKLKPQNLLLNLPLIGAS
ncbi:DUF6352 family protein [Hydrogenophaga sp.]|uniref:DUF6352 family protein n=1 Tax=Hydrogenophaga sp. TaxID=1904254 RepID=UPI003565C0BF